MKALVGIDTTGAWHPALSLLCRLWPHDLEVELVHCIESVLPDRSFPDLGANHPLGIYFQEQMQQAGQALEEAAKALETRGVRVAKHIQVGEPVRVLTEHADAHACDLIVVRSSVKGFWGTTFFGSTAKGVLMGAKQSVLVVKTDHAETGPVDAVVATDHSPYMARCLDVLVGMGTSGLGKVTVFTANEAGTGVAALLVRDLPSLAETAPLWMQEKLVAMNEAVAAKLAPYAKTVEVAVRDAHPHQGIRAAMEEAQAELLILGAQGHGFWERLQMGSKSFHQALSEPYSVLVLRKP